MAAVPRTIGAPWPAPTRRPSPRRPPRARPAGREPALRQPAQRLRPARPLGRHHARRGGRHLPRGHRRRPRPRGRQVRHPRRGPAALERGALPAHRRARGGGRSRAWARLARASPSRRCAATTWSARTTACSCRPRRAWAASRARTCSRTRATACPRSRAPSTAATSSRRPRRTSPTACPSRSWVGPSTRAGCWAWSGRARPSCPVGCRSQAIYLDTFGNVKLSALAEDLAAALPGLQLGERLVVRIGAGSGPPRGRQALGPDLRRRADRARRS